MKSNSEFILLISFFENPSEKRLSEMFECLEINQKLFNKIIIIYELPNNNKTHVLNRIIKIKGENETSTNAKIEIEFLKGRPKYTDFFKISSKYESKDNNSWFCIANSDIYFDETLYLINDIKIKEEFIIALSRYDKFEDLKKDELDAIPYTFTIEDEKNKNWKLISSKKENKLLSAIPNTFSQDAWFFRKKPINWEKYIFKIGTMFCDSFFNTQTIIDKVNIYNPCLSIRIYHNHNVSEDDKNRNKNFNEENQEKIWTQGINHFRKEIMINNDHDLYQNKNGIYFDKKKNQPYEIYIDQKYNNVILRNLKFPVCGVLWSSIESINNPLNSVAMEWNEHSIFINFKRQRSFYLSLIKIEIIIKKLINYINKEIIYEDNFYKFSNSYSMNLIIYFHYDDLNNKINKLIIDFIKNLIENSKEISFFAITDNKRINNLDYEYINFNDLKISKKKEYEQRSLIEEKIFNISTKSKIVLLDKDLINFIKECNYEDSEKFIRKIEKEIINKSINKFKNQELAKQLLDSEKRLIGID